MVMRRGDSSEGERLLAFEFRDSVAAISAMKF